MKSNWSPVVYFMENGEEGLRNKLSTFDRDELLKIVSHEHMDPTNCRSRRTDAWLIDQIVQYSIKRANKGNAFRNC